eukprot:GFYU01003393.1.p1 GENE.GFYU01003393.1~~GFYU01003393.1.p1  ORF type:complete len:237 (-),score=65.60 GFYU01003393.1:309-1019(-)
MSATDQPSELQRTRSASEPQTFQWGKNVHVLRLSAQMKAIFTIIRDTKTSREDFIFYADRLIRNVVESGLAYLPYEDTTVGTPCGEYEGMTFTGRLCGVSIVRAGESMEMALRQCCKKVRIGKILIQRDEATALPKLYYSKLPEDIANRYVLLLDPMLATGGSAAKAIEVLMEAGVKEERIIFLNVISCPEGLTWLTEKFPNLIVVTGEVDRCLDENKYIVPGIGDFGDRYFGTTD